MFACGVCSARKRSFEEASGEAEVGRRLLPPPLALEPGPLPPLAQQTRLRHGNRTPTWTTASAGAILPETGQFLLLCSLQLWHQLQRCRETRARVQVFKRILLPFYRNSLPRMICFLGKRTVTIEHSTCVKKLAAVTGLLVKFLYIEPKEEHHNCN